MLDNITVIDFETTGFQGNGNKAIEVAAVTLHGGKIQTQFQAVIHQNVKLNPKIIQLTGITQDEVSKGLPEKLAFAILNNLCANNVLVAHNMIFDSWFYNDALSRIGNKCLANPLLCTLTIARECMPGLGVYKLEALAEKFGVKSAGAHRALNDVLVTVEVLKYLSTVTDITKYVNKLGYMQKFGLPKWSPEHCTLLGQ